MARRAAWVVGCLASGVLAAGAFACTSDDDVGGVTPTDAGADRQTADTGPVVTGGCSGALPVMKARDPQTMADIEADWSCYGTTDAGFLVFDDAGTDAEPDADLDAAAPDAETDAATADAESDAAIDGGADAAPANEARFALTEFVTRDSVGSAPLDMFFGSSAAGRPDWSGTTNAAGTVSFPSPASARLLTYRSNGRDDADPAKALLPLIWYENPLLKAPRTNEGFAISKQSAKILLQSLLGSQPVDPNKALLVSGARDCQNRDLSGGVFELIDDATGQPLATGKNPGDLRTAYFRGLGPDTTCTFTSNDQSVWAAVNVPTTMPGQTASYTLRLKGRMHETDATPVVLGEKKLELWKGTVTVSRPHRLTAP